MPSFNMPSTQSAKTTQLGIALIGIVIAAFLFFPQYSIDLIAQFTQYSIDQFGLIIVLFSSLMVILAVAISISPLGKLRLGGQDAVPEFSLFSWFAMLFTCGMGSGLIFWGVAEPVFHFASLPDFNSTKGGGIDESLALTYFHWGIQAWSIYALAGLAVGWFAFNRGRSFQISATFNSQSSWFRLVDWLAILAIIFGVAGTFANAIALIQTGVEQTIAPEISSVTFRYSTILLITLLFTASSVLGLQKGIKRLSLFNLILMLFLLASVIVIVNPLNVAQRFFSSTVTYLSILPEVSFQLSEQSRNWSLGWTVIYIIWWVAWTPFVAPFIARISRGRSVRQFFIAVIGIPTAASILWFCAFGGMALEQPFADNLIQAVQNDYTQGLFYFFDQLPMGNFLAVLAIILLVAFLITSADSALLVCGLLAGNESTKGKILWASVLVGLSMALMYINDVDLNKQVAVAGAIPFALVMLVQIIVMLRDMRKQLTTKQ